MNLLDAALAYAEMGLSVIPVKPHPDTDEENKKKPYIPWTEFQTRRATPQEIRAWFKKYPNMLIGIVTGKISDIFVVDCDSEEAYRRIQELLPDSFITCVAKTPRGYHLYFAYPKEQKISNATGILPGVDVRGEGGYIIAPPSVRQEGKYVWMPGLSIEEQAPVQMPSSLYIYLNNSLSLYKGGCKGGNGNKPNSLQFLTQGTRDDDLFHVGNCLIKGGCKEDTARQVLEILAKNCNPAFPEKEAHTKIDSVLTRCERRERNLTEDLRKWIDLTSAYFSLTEAYEPLQILTSQKNTVHQIMHRLVKEEYVERHPHKNGIYRRIDRDIEFMDFVDADISNTVNLLLPLGIHFKTAIYPKGVIVVAGVSGMGKTLFALNTINENRLRFPIFYFNSEMGPEALKKKLSYFPASMKQWTEAMKVIDNWDFNNIPDKIQPDALNVIDYLEPEGERPYNIHGVISSIIRRLRKGTALITVQKKPDSRIGTGGMYSVKASSLAVALDWGKIEIVKNRFREADHEPQKNKINFTVEKGFNIVKQGNWY